MAKYKITRPDNDGRTSFAGIKFEGSDSIITDDPNIIRKAKDTGWKVEKIISKKINKKEKVQ